MRLLLVSLFAFGVCGMNAMAADKAETRVFEFRTYTAAPGKMKDLNARFRDHTCKLLEKHGMTLIGFWTPTDPKGAEETLFYIVAHPSEEAAKKAWDNFRKDPDWIKAKNESEKNGPIVSKVEAKFFKATDYSKIK
jgi:NIPSNAP